MALDFILITIGTVLVIIGIIGCILPALPGVPLNYIAIILLQFTSKINFSTEFLVAWGIIIIIVQLLDYYIPIWGTKKLGGGSYGVWGSAIGMVLGLFIFPPWGFIVLPFVCAVIGEILDNKEFSVALKAGFGAFVGFLAGIIMKLVVAIILSFFFFREVVRYFINN
ncbi:MAG TPA: DUF456 domain-containing protein [Dysgonomonas sp.]|uniref:DUF456 domain-containing protein n=1 Tax=Dysgonomonas sp. TaxID=1891233 RepID=UPI002C8985DD|nr:DUF456 domain-containing protein [Dysgonomonas sp.]HML63597.1 DUF456 domain-containing protein [Dysgonomonas sp.]